MHNRLNALKNSFQNQFLCLFSMKPISNLSALKEASSARSLANKEMHAVVDQLGDEDANLTMNNPIESVRATGVIGVVGVFAEADPKAPDKLAKKGQLAINWGKFWSKGLRVGTGQANVKAYNRQLCQLIEQGKVEPSFIVSHELPLEEAPDAYKHFDARDKGWTKVILKPAGQRSRLPQLKAQKLAKRQPHHHAH